MLRSYVTSWELTVGRLTVIMWHPRFWFTSYGLGKVKWANEEAMVSNTERGNLLGRPVLEGLVRDDEAQILVSLEKPDLRSLVQ